MDTGSNNYFLLENGLTFSCDEIAILLTILMPFRLNPEGKKVLDETYNCDTSPYVNSIYNKVKDLGLHSEDEELISIIKQIDETQEEENEKN